MRVTRSLIFKWSLNILSDLSFFELLHYLAPNEYLLIMRVSCSQPALDNKGPHVFVNRLAAMDVGKDCLFERHDLVLISRSVSPVCVYVVECVAIFIRIFIDYVNVASRERGGALADYLVRSTKQRVYVPFEIRSHQGPVVEERPADDTFSAQG